MAAKRSGARFAAFLLASTVIPAAVPAADPVGVWSGTLEREGSRVQVELELARRGDRIEGTFSSAPLRAVGIPLSNIESQPPILKWQLAGDARTIVAEGEAGADRFAGRYREGTASGTFELRRAPASLFSAREEEIAFDGGDGVALSGTIVWPQGLGPFPGIVFLHGSGAEGRWASRYLAHEFARGGIAALIYDKRGVGASKGEWRSAGFEELVKDAAAAVEALRVRPGIVQARVGVHGHSQGGTIAPWVAVANPNIAFVIASAASGVTTAQAEIYSLDNNAKARGVAPEDEALAKRFVRTIVAVAYEGAPRSQLDEVRRAAEGRRWAFEIPPESASYWAFSRKINDYDPLHWWSQVQVPVLLVYGGRDERVPVQPSISRITPLLRPASNYTLKVFPEGDHGFRLKYKASGFAWPETVAGYPDSLVAWTRLVTSR